MSDSKREELSKLIHMEALSKSSGSNKLGELTVVPIGYVSQIALKFIDQLLIEKQERIENLTETELTAEKGTYEIVVNKDSVINILKE